MRSLLNSDLRGVAALLASVSVMACNDPTATTSGSQARLRIVNSVFQGATAATAVSVSIDVLVDSSTSAPGSVIGLVPISITAGTAGAQGPNAGYTALPATVHSFVAKVSGAANPTLYTSTATTTYLPRQALTPFPFTLVVAGIAPVSGLNPPTAVPYVMLTDDPFKPPVDTFSHTGLTARVQVINAAPYADPNGAGAGAKISFTFAGMHPVNGSANYRASSGYLNPPAGSYTLMLTVTSGTGSTAVTYTLYNQPVTLAAGEVRTFVVQSTGYAAKPSAVNTKVTTILDSAW